MNNAEYKRILELVEFDLDYTDIKESLSDLNLLAARVAGTSVSLVNLIDQFTQWSVSDYGLDILQMSREDSVCHYTINDESQEFFEVKDLSKDERFKDKFYVVNDPNLTYYFGIPLKTTNGRAIGALCVLDKQHKLITPEKRELLTIISKEVVKRLESIKKHNKLKQKVAELIQIQKKLSHDIRSPLGGIMGIAHIVNTEGNEFSKEEITELMGMIQKGGQSILELAEEILTDNDAKQTEVHPQKTSLSSYYYSCPAFIEKLETLYNPQARVKNISLKFSYPAEIKQIGFPKNKLLQIVGNILSNSIKFTPPEGEVNVEFTLLKNNDTPRMNIVISDTGSGFSATVLSQFETGNYESEKGTKGETGYGFGLSLVRHLVGSIDGSIAIRNAPSGGAEVIFNIPITSTVFFEE